MQLKLRVGGGDTLTIDVQPSDTFQSLSDRLYSLGGVKVDLSQLKSIDKPFDMSTNVVQYFTQKPETEKVEEERRFRFCRLCSENIPLEPHYIFQPKEDGPIADKMNAALPITVSPKDHLPKQICTKCLGSLNNSFDFMKRVVKAQKTLEKIYSKKENFAAFEREPEAPPALNSCCPLCTTGKLKGYEANGMSSCMNGATQNPNRKESVVKKEVVIAVPRNHIKTEQPSVDPDSLFKRPDDIFEEDKGQKDEVVTEYWDGSVPTNLDFFGKVRRKKIKTEDDADWTIDEEYVPVNRRGRPKGTKNKPKAVMPTVEKSCVLCGWLGAESDIFFHAINQHCQPDMGYFPCPLCRSKQPNEMILETHIDRHVIQSKSGHGQGLN